MPIDLSGLTTAADKFEQARQRKIADLSQACRDAILSGFDSDALGTVHHYPASPEDQTNLLGRVMQAQMFIDVSGWTVTFACADAAGVWSKPKHTAEQMIAVGVAGAHDVETKTNRYSALVAQATAATTIEQLAAVQWQD